MNIINTLGSLFRSSSTGATQPTSATTPVPQNQPITPPERQKTALRLEMEAKGVYGRNDGGKSHTQAGGPG
jgi:hypothetical protein